MEPKEGMSHTGVTVLGAEAPSNYLVAPRVENNHSTQVPEVLPMLSPTIAAAAAATTTTPVAVSGGGVSGGATEKKKRGRPRKYGPDGTMTLSPRPISSSIPTGEFSPGKRGRGRGSGYDGKLQKKMGVDNFGDANGNAGTNFMPHIITVNAGEDITMKIISFSQQGPRAICILSANGVISNVTLRQSDSSGGTLTYEGRFEILSLSGSFMPTESQGTRSRSGGMSVSLASPDGRVVGGSVAGLLVAAGPVQVVVGSFLPGNHLEQKPKKQTFDFARASYPSVAAGPDHTNAGDDAMVGHGLQNSDTGRPNLDSPPTFRGENWATMHNLQDSQKVATDINVSLPG